MLDRLLRGAVALWFLALSLAVAYGLGGMLARDAPFAAIDGARLASHACLLSFLAMMGYLTLVRESPVARAGGWQPRVSAVAGTNLVFVALFFLTPRDDLGVGAHLLSAGLVLAGNLLCVYVLSHLGRSFSIMAEARRLVLDGPYAIVRHPLYLAEQIALFGVFILVASLPATMVVALHFAIQFRRMRNEETVLAAAFPEYATYMSRTARLIPAIW
jgi:protein-S-isoprenylcysteine O-methyltransferase Ste14